MKLSLASGSRVSARTLFLLAATAIVVLGTTFALAWRFWPADYARASDTPVYWRYGEPIVHGEVPYRDFRVAYPPASLPVFVLPAVALGSTDGARWAPFNEAAMRYSGTFAALMIALAAATIVFTSVSLAALRRGRPEAVLALGLLGSSAVLLGGLVYTRWDLWPAALTAAALALLLRDRVYVTALALGLAIAVKLYAAVLVPLVAVFVWRRRGRRQALAVLGVTAVAVGAIFLPFGVVAPGGLSSSLGSQLGRGLQVESLGSAGLVAVSHALGKLHGFGLPVHSLSLSAEGNRSGLKTQELRGTGVRPIGLSLGLLRAVSLVALWAAFARGPATGDRLVRYVAATLVALVALSQVLSPEYLIWLLPIVPLVGGRRGLAATGLLAAAMAATHVWYPHYYDVFTRELSLGPTAVLLLKDLLLVAVLAVLVWPQPRAGRPVSVAEP